MSLTDGLISSWRYNGDWKDQIGSNNGTPSGAIIDPSNALLGSAASLYDGLNDLSNFGNDSSFDLANFTISMWIYPTAIPGAYLISKREAPQQTYFVQLVATGIISFGLWAGSAVGSNTGAGAVVTGAWQNVVVSFDSSWMKTYVNGVLKKKTANSGSAVISTADVVMGNVSTGGLPYKGGIDQTDYWNRGLTDGDIAEEVTATGEIAQVYNNNLGLELGGIILPRRGIGHGLYNGLGRRLS